MLTDDQLADIRRRKNRFMGQWTGTSGALAADCHYLLEDRKTMQATIDTLEQTNAEMRRAIESRQGGGCCDGGKCQPAPEEVAIPVDWILQGEREMKQQPKPSQAVATAAGNNTAEQLLLSTLEVIRDRRPKYGGPKQHFARTVGMINAAFGEILKRPLTEADWALIMILDKVARYSGPSKTADGPVDMAGYAACLAEVESP